MSGNPPHYDPFHSTALYTLRYRKPVPCNDLLKWGKWTERSRRHVRNTYIEGIQISTVFLGIDHNYNLNGEPLLFETMVFPDEDIQFRCSTWREALNQHWEVVHSVKAKLRWLDERSKI